MSNVWTLSVLAALSVLLAAWHRDRIKDADKPAVVRAIRLWGCISLLAIAASGIAPYVSDKQSQVQRSAQTKAQVLSALQPFRVELLDNYFFLLRHSSTTQNYVNYEAARRSVADFPLFSSWESLVTSSTRTELENSMQAFGRLQRIAREVLMQEATYPLLVPQPLSRWATQTLSLSFIDVPRLMNSHIESQEAVKYAESLGQAVGALTHQSREVAGIAAP